MYRHGAGGRGHPRIGDSGDNWDRCSSYTEEVSLRPGSQVESWTGPEVWKSAQVPSSSWLNPSSELGSQEAELAQCARFEVPQEDLSFKEETDLLGQQWV
jgi:hypothetical protein